eukprot:m.97623 g.97623  ORF g.97623 m.97623 type:complete len:456 (-) comp15538_c0_seq1:1751-3118(-)
MCCVCTVLREWSFYLPRFEVQLDSKQTKHFAVADSQFSTQSCSLSQYLPCFSCVVQGGKSLIRQLKLRGDEQEERRRIVEDEGSHSEAEQEHTDTSLITAAAATSNASSAHSSAPSQEGLTPVLIREVVFVLYCTAVMCLQHFNVHHWHFERYNKSLMVFCIMMVSRRLLWKLVGLSMRASAKRRSPTAVLSLRLSVFLLPFLVALLLVWREAIIFRQLPIVIYPLVIHFALFGHRIARSKLRVLPAATHFHPDAILLDFRFSMASVIYSAFEATYYATYLTVRFVADPNQHFAMRQCIACSLTFFLNTFCFLSVAYFVSRQKELNMQSRCLGCWDRRWGTGSGSAWSRSQEWLKGAQVKHRRKLYIAVGEVNTAEPGDTIAWLFFKMVTQYRRTLSWIVGVQVVVTACLLAYLIMATRWYSVVSWGTMTILNYVVLLYIIYVRRKVLATSLHAK